MLLGFTGKLGSGKDTAGARMAELTRWDAVQLSFAKPLKQSAAALLDIEPIEWETYKNDKNVKILLVNEQPEDFEYKEYVDDGFAGDILREFTAREFLQRYGTESHRDVFGSDFWVDQALNGYYRSAETYHYFTDARFPNEADAIKANHGLIIRVLGENESTGGHASEAGLPDQYIDFEIDNSVRGDGFLNLDSQLEGIAQMVGIPLNPSVFA